MNDVPDQCHLLYLCRAFFLSLQYMAHILSYLLLSLPHSKLEITVDIYWLGGAQTEYQTTSPML